jgi:hypothetical protein
MRWSDAGYELMAAVPAAFVAVRAPVERPIGDATIRATLRKVGGPAGGGYGIVARDQASGTRDGHSQDGRFYVFEVGDAGEVGIWRRENDRWVDLLPWTRADAVRTGLASNSLTVDLHGDALTFRVNGVEVASVKDAALGPGGVGVFAGGDSNAVVVESFAVDAVE